jgi:hypothetical protein
MKITEISDQDKQVLNLALDCMGKSMGVNALNAQRILQDACMQTEDEIVVDEDNQG